MSVNLITSRPVMTSPRQWLVADHGPLRNMIANVDGAELKYVHPRLGRIVTKKFTAGSLVSHMKNTNTLNYFSSNEIPLEGSSVFVPEIPSGLVSGGTVEKIADVAEDAAGLL